LTCMQIYEECKDLIWKLNTFKIEMVPQDNDDKFQAAQKHPVWSKICNVEFHGTFAPWGTWKHPQKCVDDETSTAFQAAKVLSDANF
jgi:hypothetical protein